MQASQTGSSDEETPWESVNKKSTAFKMPVLADTFLRIQESLGFEI